MDLSTDYLRTFVAVAECRSFSLAADRVHKSQGAVSTQIARLEEEAGVRLIDRTRRQFELTDAGELFFVFAKETLARTEELYRNLEQLRSGVRGTVRIGATRTVGIYVMPDIIKRVASELPQIKVSLFTQSRNPIYEQLRKGELDFAVVLAETAPDGLVTERLRPEPLCFVVSSTHPLARRKTVSAKELAMTPFAIGIKGNEFADMVDRILEKRGISPPSVGLTISNLQGRKQAACAGVGVAVLPNFAVQDEIRNKTLTELTVKGIELNDTYLMLIERRKQRSNRAVERVRQVVKKQLSAPR